MNAKKRLLITGASGFLGWNICHVAAPLFEITGVSNANQIQLAGIRQERCDLTRLAEVRTLFGRSTPDVVIHAAAVATPNTCQEDPGTTEKTNVSAAVYIARLCNERHIPLAFTSTDLVFDGMAAPYAEDRPVSPISVYGEQKARAEKEMRAEHDDLRICRMPLMYGDAVAPAQSFIQGYIRALLEGKELTLFTNEFRSPASAVNAAQAILCALDHAPGTYHCGGRQSVSRCNFCIVLAKSLGIDHPKLRGVRQQEVVSNYPRPLDVSLDSSKLFAMGYNPGTIEEELEKLDCVISAAKNICACRASGKNSKF